MPDKQLRSGEAGPGATANGIPVFAPHDGRAAALGEIHSRPFPVVESGRVICHLAFTSEGGSSVSHGVLAELCRARGLSAPDKQARYHEMPWDKGKLRWERHSEFTTWSWEGPTPTRFKGALENLPFGTGFSQPGMLISACRVEIRKRTPATLKYLQQFNAESLCVTVLDDGKSLLATDFRQDGAGMTVFLLLEDNLGAARIGYIAKAAIEIETYRTLAMLGLPLAQSLSAKLSGFEAELARLTSEMRRAVGSDVQQLLDEITKLAGDLEADAAASLFRFGATRAYGDIVAERMEMIGSRALEGSKDISGYLDLRLAPALRTCRSVEERQANLSRKLTRTANLLRTRIEVEIEHQNRDLLDSMNRRARQQLRLQQTVEGLSVAAVSYYVVGLFYYVMQAAEPFLPAGISPKVATGMFVPVSLLSIWWVVRRIRRSHAED